MSYRLDRDGATWNTIGRVGVWWGVIDAIKAYTQPENVQQWC